MRSLDERIAEINRRSEKIIGQRKRRRKRVLAACVPLCLCVCLAAAATVLPSWQKTGKTEMFNESCGGVPAGGLDGAEAFIGSVEVTGSEGVRLYSSREAVSEIAALIDGIRVADTGTEPEYGFEAEAAVNGRPAPAEKGYHIVLTRSDGTVERYYLADTSLVDQSTGKSYALSDQERLDLLAALELPGD